MNNLWLGLCFLVLNIITMSVGIRIGMRIQKTEQAEKDKILASKREVVGVTERPNVVHPKFNHAALWWWWAIEATLIWNGA